MTTNNPPCRLYLISPWPFEQEAFAAQLKQALEADDVAAFQLRMKEAVEEDIARAVDMLMPLCHQHEVAFILNDRVDLAKKLGTDGVHIGEEQDGTVAEARTLLGEDKIIGYSCYASKDRAFEAGEQGADYVAFGQFYPSTTKPAKGHPVPELLTWWQDYTVLPSVAIGGITPGNAALLVQAGTDFLAVVSAVWEHPDGPAAAVKEFNEVMRENT